jgi:alpha-L-fucosidase
VASLRIFGEHLANTFAVNLAAGASFAASNVRGNDPFYGPERLLDSDPWSAWVSDDAVTTPELTLTLPSAKTFNLIRLREDIRLGLRLEGVAVDAMVHGEWKELAKAEAIGTCRLWRVPATTTGKLRIRATKSPVCPALSDFGLLLEPDLPAWVPPVGEAPKVESLSKSKWKILTVSSEHPPVGAARNAIDERPDTFWHTHGRDGERVLPQEIAIDLGEEKNLKCFTYLPRQDGKAHGMVDRYEFLVSKDGKQWRQVAAGEYGTGKEESTTYQLGYEHCDTICKKWFWFEGDRPRPVSDLAKLYRDTHTAGGNLLLNVPPDRTGRIPEYHVKALMELKEEIK